MNFNIEHELTSLRKLVDSLEAEKYKMRIDVENHRRIRENHVDANRAAQARVSKAEAMLKALDDYWALHPDNDTDMQGDCPYCEEPNRSHWEHEYCFENAWARFEKLRKEFEESGK